MAKDLSIQTTKSGVTLSQHGRFLNIEEGQRYSVASLLLPDEFTILEKILLDQLLTLKFRWAAWAMIQSVALALILLRFGF